MSINTVNNNQKDFVFNLMKGYSVSSFFKKSETKAPIEGDLYDRSKLKALEILLKCEKNVKVGIKKFLPEVFNKDITEDQKSILLNTMKSFDIRNANVSLFENNFIWSLDCQRTTKLKPKQKSEESIEERTKLRRQRFDEIAKNKEKINTELFKNTLSFCILYHMYTLSFCILYHFVYFIICIKF